MKFVSEACWMLAAAFAAVGMVIWLLAGGWHGIHPGPEF